MQEWSDFYVALGGAAAALTGLLFIAVSLRPREIRTTPLMVGRARSAFYAFATITFVALLALAGTGSRWVGLAQAGVALGMLGASMPFTVAAHRSGPAARTGATTRRSWRRGHWCFLRLRSATPGRS